MTTRLSSLLKFTACIITACAFIANESLAQLTDTRWTEPVNLGDINTPDNEFAPVWNRFESRLYFNSEKSGYSLFYTSTLNDTMGFTAPTILPGEVNRTGNNQSYITFASDEIAYLSTFRLSTSRSYLNIFQTFFKRKEWIRPFVVDSLASESFSSHPTVSPEGSVMVFSSDRQSASGETDLWIAYLQPDGSWAGVSNISELNSSGNEITPFLASDDTLYFASDGLGGMGGYDMFVSYRSEGVWQRPFPLSDLNTKYDESDFTLLPGGRAVFASNRPGGRGKLDLYLSRSYQQQRQNNVFVSDLELSIAVQVQSVRTMSETYYRSLPLVPYIFTGTDLPAIIQSSGKIYPCVDSVFINTLHILGDRLRQYPHASLSISVYNRPGGGAPSEEQTGDSSAINIAGQLKAFLIDKEYVNASRVIVTAEDLPADIASNSIGVPLVRFDSDEPAIFEPIQVGNRDVNVDPSGLDIELNARPAKMLKNWVFGIKSSDGLMIDTLKSGSNPEQFLLDLKPFGRRLADTDSLVLNLTCTDTLGQKATVDRVINIFHSELKSSELIKEDQRAFEEYLFFVADGRTIAGGNLNTRLIQKITASAEYTNGLTVRYFDTNPSTVKNAGLLAEELKRKINNSYVKVATELAPYSGKESFGRQFAPYVLSVLVEK